MHRDVLLPTHHLALWLAHPHAGGGSFSSRTDWDYHCFLVSRTQEESRFGCHSCSLPRGIWSIFPSWFWGLCVKFPSRIGWESVFFPIAVCVSFPMVSLLRECCWFHIFCWLCCFYMLGCCRLLWSRFGHDRAKNDPGVVSLIQAVIVGWLHAYSGWSSNCVWSGDEGLVCLKNLVGLGTTQIELEGWLSSPQPVNSTGREVKVWGTALQRKD